MEFLEIKKNVYKLSWAIVWGWFLLFSYSFLQPRLLSVYYMPDHLPGVRDSRVHKTDNIFLQKELTI